MAFIRKATKGTGGDFKATLPFEGNHKAAIVAVVELGTHYIEYKGEGSDKPQLLVCYELLDEQDDKGGNLLMAMSYTDSLDEKANLRKVVTAAGFKLKVDEDFDFTRLLGRPLRLTVEHQSSRTDAEKKYAKIAGLSPADRGDIPADGKRVTTQQSPFCWQLSDGAWPGYTWIPYVMDSSAGKPRPAGDIIADSHERKTQPTPQRQAATADDQNGVAF